MENTHRLLSGIVFAVIAIAVVTLRPEKGPPPADAWFQKAVLESSKPVVVKFGAEWCGPCKAMAPALDQLASEMHGKVKVVKVDVDQNPGITAKYQIRAMPTLMIFKGGQVAAQHVGALVQKKKLEDWVNGTLVS